MVTVQAPPIPQQAIPLRELGTSPQNFHHKPKFIRVPVVQHEPQVSSVVPQPNPRPIPSVQPQYSPPVQYSPHVSLPHTLRYPNTTFLLPQPVPKPIFTEDEEVKKIAGKRQKWGRPTFEVCFIVHFICLVHL